MSFFLCRLSAWDIPQKRYRHADNRVFEFISEYNPVLKDGKMVISSLFQVSDLPS